MKLNPLRRYVFKEKENEQGVLCHFQKQKLAIPKGQ